MKKNVLFIILAVCCLCGCEKRISSETKIYVGERKMGYNSILSYQYLQYTADSALVKIRAIERDSISLHYTHAEIILGDEVLAESTSLPIEAEAVVPLINDTTIMIKHLCWVDSLDSVIHRDQLGHQIQIHKGEIINSNPDTISLYYSQTVIEDIDVEIH